MEAVKMELNQADASKTLSKAWGFWILGASFYFFKNLSMVAPSVMTSELMQAFGVTATGLGNLAACFFYAYLLMQIPVGIILDRYGIRWVTGSAIIICALCTFIFANAHSLWVAQIARAGVGLSGAFASVSSFKLASAWFTVRRFAFVAGLGLAIGMIGAFAGGSPLAALIAHTNWRTALMIISVGMFILGILYLIIIRDPPHSHHHNPAASKSLFVGLRQVLVEKQTWVLCLFSALAYTPISVFNGLWGVPFLHEALHLTNEKAAGLLSLGFIGFAVGCPLAGWLMDRLGKAVRIMQVGTFIALIALVILLYKTPASLTSIGILNFIFGACIGSYFLSFGLMRLMHPLQFAATAIAIMTTFETFCQAVSQPIIGIMLDHSWSGLMVDGVPHYSLDNFHNALWLFPGFLIVALVLLFFVKEKSQL